MFAHHARTSTIGHQPERKASLVHLYASEENFENRDGFSDAWFRHLQFLGKTNFAFGSKTPWFEEKHQDSLQGLQHLLDKKVAAIREAQREVLPAFLHTILTPAAFTALDSETDHIVKYSWRYKKTAVDISAEARASYASGDQHIGEQFCKAVNIPEAFREILAVTKYCVREEIKKLENTQPDVKATQEKTKSGEGHADRKMTEDGEEDEEVAMEEMPKQIGCSMAPRDPTLRQEVSPNTEAAGKKQMKDDEPEIADTGRDK